MTRKPAKECAQIRHQTMSWHLHIACLWHVSPKRRTTVFAVLRQEQTAKSLGGQSPKAIFFSIGHMNRQTVIDKPPTGRIYGASEYQFRQSLSTKRPYLRSRCKKIMSLMLGPCAQSPSPILLWQRQWIKKNKIIGVQPSGQVDLSRFSVPYWTTWKQMPCESQMK